MKAVYHGLLTMSFGVLVGVCVGSACVHNGPTQTLLVWFGVVAFCGWVYTAIRFSKELG